MTDREYRAMLYRCKVARRRRHRMEAAVQRWCAVGLVVIVALLLMGAAR